MKMITIDTAVVTCCLPTWNVARRRARRSLYCIMFAFLASVAFSLTSRAASVETDRLDYPPGATATITGAGFGANDVVTVQVLHADGTPSTGEDHEPWTVNADASGNFTTIWIVCTDDCVGALLRVTAVGNPSGESASATFTDAIVCSAPPNGTAPVSLPAGGFGIEGDLLANIPTSGVGDWVSNSVSSGGGFVLYTNGTPVDTMTTSHFIDLQNSSTDDNFAGGNKVDDDPNIWTWVRNPVLAKDDINHALVHITKDANGHTWVVIAGDRRSNNGDSYIDFEFLQNSLTVTTNSGNTGGGFISGGPNCGRTTNDFLLTLTFTKGGSQAGLCFSRWQAVSGSGTPPCGFDYVDATPSLPTNAVFAAVNTNIISVPYGAFGSTTYDVNQFAEAAVDLTAFLGTFNPCLTVGVKGVFIKTKTSQSPSATIVDFIAPLEIKPPLVIGPSADAGPDQAKCSEGATTTFTLNGSVTPGVNPITSTNWTCIAGCTGVTISSPNSLTTTVTLTGAPTNATLRLTVTDSGTCANNFTTNDVVLTVNALPACSITGSNGPVCPSSASLTYTGPAGMDSYLWTISGNGSISGANSGQTVAVNPGSGCDASFTLTLAITKSGCSNICTQTVTVQDVTPPIITCPAAVSPIQCPNTPVFPTPTASDTCDLSLTVTFADVTTPGACAGTYTTVRTWTATDDCGNSASCSQSVSVIDTTPPTISCPAATSPIQCPAAPVFPAPTASDLCDLSLTVTFADVTTPGACAGTYSTTRTWTATDDCGNSASCSQSVDVIDTTPPIITCPTDVTVDCKASTAPAATGTATATDNCSAIASITSSDMVTAGAGAGCYSIARTWKVTDACGNSSTASQTINVQDITAPVIAPLPAPTTIACPATPNFATATATDACDPSVTLTFADVTTAGLPACPGNYSVTRTWTATDDCGNSSTASQTINVRDITAPVLSGCPSTAATYLCYEDVPPAPTVTATDSCDPSVPVVFTETQSNPGSSCSNTITRTWSATDDCNNTKTCVQTITVNDTTKPIVTCPPDYYANCGNCSVDPNVTGRPTATDNCNLSGSGVVFTYSDVYLSDPNICPWTLMRTWTATDSCGNKETCIQKISCVPFSWAMVTDSALCSYDLDLTTSCRDFRLLFTQDTGGYKLNASNPGQTYYNVFYTGIPGASVTFNLTLPYPYVTQGANPLHAYDGVTISGAAPTLCLTPGKGVPISTVSPALPLTLAQYSPKSLGSTRTITVTMTVPASGFIYLNLHLDYGLKGTTGYGKGGTLGNDAINPTTSAVLIPDRGSYTFSVSGGMVASDGVCNINAFKKNPGVGGRAGLRYTLDGASDIVATKNAAATLKDAKGTVLSTGITDEDGWYLLTYKYTGKATTLYITLKPVGKPAQTKSITMKANGFVEVNFDVP